jgi:phosphate transport system substrate-binding protein
MYKTLVVAMGATLLAGAASAADISGAGATFPAPVYAKWAEAYKAQTGIGMNYQAIGSGGGIKQIKAKTVQFGATDKPLGGEELNASGLFQFPTVMGGVVPVTNLPNVAPGELKMTGAIVADIFLGKITKWNDPRIAALNPGKRLPPFPITVVHRADGSGTTYVFTSYLALKSPEWKSKVGANSDVAWPLGQGGKGNDGVAAQVKQTPGAFGYVEYNFARANKLDYISLASASGAYIQPTEKTFANAAARANWSSAPGFGISLLDQPGDAWPITSATFILVYKNQPKAADGEAVLKFFDWAYKNGDGQAGQLDYVPLPAAVKSLVRKEWAAEVKSAGKPVYVSK